jgi:hypothetical protein
MLKWLWPGSRSPAANRDSLPVRNTQNGRAGQNPPSAVLASAAAAEEGHSTRTPHVPDEAPMTPVVYVVRASSSCIASSISMYGVVCDPVSHTAIQLQT